MEIVEALKILGDMNNKLLEDTHSKFCIVGRELLFIRKTIKILYFISFMQFLIVLTLQYHIFKK